MNPINRIVLLLHITAYIALTTLLLFAPARSAEAAIGDFLYKWGAPYQFAVPDGIAAGNNGRIYVVDAGSPYISVFDTSGTLLNRFTPTSPVGSCRDVAVGPSPANRIYAICGFDPAVHVFDSEENFLFSFGSYGYEDGQFIYATALTVSDNGEVFVGDAWPDPRNNNIQVLTADGVYLREWQHTGGLPSGLEFDGVGDLYMTDYYGGSGGVVGYNPDTGELVDRWRPSAPWAFRIQGLAIDRAAEELYLMIEHLGEVRVYSLQDKGNFIRPPLRVWHGDESGVGRLTATVKDLTLGPDSRVYIAEGHSYGVEHSMVKVFDTLGTFEEVWRAQSDVDGRFAFPSAITVDDSGRVLVADDGNQRVQVFTPAGDFLSSFLHEPGLNNTTGIAVDEAGWIFTGTISPNSVRAYSPSGEFQYAWDVPFNTSGTVVGGIAAANGQVYVADRTQVQVFGNDGSPQGVLDWVGGIQYASSTHQTSNPYRTRPYLAAPTDVEIGADGRIYVVDGGNIVGFDANHEAVSWTPLPGIGSLVIKSFAMDACGNIFALATAGRFPAQPSIRAFDATGLPIGEWSANGIEDGEFREPRGVAVDRAGRVFVSDSDNHRVQVFAGITTCGVPLANAGVDLLAHPGVTVTLDGSGSSDPGGTELSYEWQLLSSPETSTAFLVDPTAISPTFVPDALGEYRFALTVINAWGVYSEADEILVTAINAVPTADAGPDQEVILIGTTIQLEGAVSDPDGDALMVAWSFVSLPPGSQASLSDPGLLDPTFVADRNGNYELSLLVSDPWGGTATDTLTVSFINFAPVADAGPPQSVIEGDMALLDGSASSDTNGDVLAFSWQFSLVPEGSVTELINADSATPSFVADVPGEYSVSLVVTDGIVPSEPASVTVTTISHEEALDNDLAELLEDIDTFPETVFARENMRNTLANKINAAMNMAAEGNYAEALDKMRNDLLPKTDGCAIEGAPQQNDWITNCEEQTQVYNLISHTIRLLELLIG